MDAGGGTFDAEQGRGSMLLIGDAERVVCELSARPGVATSLSRLPGVGVFEYDNMNPKRALEMEKRVKRAGAQGRWNELKALVLPLAALDADAFDALDVLARRLRKSDLPMGGLQLVMHGPARSSGKPIHKAQRWDRLFPEVHVLPPLTYRLPDALFGDIADRLPPHAREELRGIAG